LDSVLVHEFAEHETHDLHWNTCPTVLQHLCTESVMHNGGRTETNLEKSER
jgi:hypothetical protein